MTSWYWKDCGSGDLRGPDRLPVGRLNGVKLGSGNSTGSHFGFLAETASTTFCKNCTAIYTLVSSQRRNKSLKTDAIVG